MLPRYATLVALALLLVQPFSLEAQRDSRLTTGRIPPHPQTVPGATKPVLPIALPTRPLPISRFRLLAPNIGWAATNGALFRTTDGGKTWSDITPPNPHHLIFNPNHDNLASISFEDPNQGTTVLAYQTGPDSDDWSFDLSRTLDGGKSWATTALILPGVKPDQLLGTAEIDFSDSLHGWINVGLKSSAVFQLGAIFTTVDGGLHWNPLVGDPGFAGPILSLSTGRGWVVAHDGNELYSVNGGVARAVSLTCPPELGACGDARYSLPAFPNPQHGYEAVSYSQASSGKIVAVLFHTQNSGLTWTPYSTLMGLGETYRNGSNSRTSVSQDLWIVPVVHRRQAPWIMRIPESGSMTADASTETDENPETSFISPDKGWIYSGRQLLATDDGGISWENVTPSSGVTHQPVKKSSSGSTQVPDETLKVNGTTSLSAEHLQSAPSVLSVPTTGVDQRLGFDGYSVPSLTFMQTWWGSSPYYDIAFYLNGSESHKADPNLTPNWVTGVTT